MTDTNSNQKMSSHKRNDYLSWDDYFMGVAFLAARRSKDPVTAVGACIVDQQKRIVAIGYNGMPRGCSDDEFPWTKDTEDELDSKHFYVCHAEANAILNKNSHNVENCIIYVGLFPCNECAKLIIQSGIKTVIYMSDKHSHKTKTIASKRLLDAAKVEYRYGHTNEQYVPELKKIVIDFNEINWNQQNQAPETPIKKVDTL